ncbi:MAG TPA: hypothetical protein GX692_02900 [Acholeplasmataceae bacterium]|jgi:hypothetical protein|nr:hypothetical protein [Acholeplasmataceae bacterium]
MRESCECRSCGNIIYVTDKKCPYCGSVKRPRQQEKTTYSSSQTRNKHQDGTSYASYQTKNKKDEEINWVIFIVLLIAFWPAAIIYLLVKESNKKKN